MTDSSEHSTWDDLDLDSPDQEEETTPPPGARKGAHFLLPQALVESAIGMLGIEQIKSSKSFCLVVQAPAGDWVTPLFRYFKLLGIDWDFHQSKSTAPRSSAQPDEISVAQTTQALAMGGRCLGVSQRLSLLPGAMVSAADLTLVLPHPTARVVDAVIKSVTGRMPRGLEDRTVSVLDFDEIASSIRAGSSARACVERLRAAAIRKVRPDQSVDDAPLLEDLHGYGAAKEFCLELVQDLEAWRRGEIPWSAVSSNAVLCGIPGVGKTTLLKSLARSAGIPLIATSVGAWFANSPGYLDSVIKQIDAVFASARSQAPAIVLLDELDAIPSRATISRAERIGGCRSSLTF